MIPVEREEKYMSNNRQGNGEFNANMSRFAKTDYGPEPFTANIEKVAEKNTFYRSAFWTGDCLQMTLMCIPVGGDIGVEMHSDTDQFIRVEQGQGMVIMGTSKEHMSYRCRLLKGDGVFIPKCTWHNIINTGKCPLKLSSIYAPPHHPKGTIHQTKKDSEQSGY